MEQHTWSSKSARHHHHHVAAHRRRRDDFKHGFQTDIFIHIIKLYLVNKCTSLQMIDSPAGLSSLLCLLTDQHA
ncbi:hypothetical protein SORBI_3003G042600 [Sorghum bicolor]|uniref:Uncharacterized protein n=1 Tax=Sorghum bicolor TaxID=4558 RepID=A0A1B6Q193_SORBI|nr:hypothetical protein SORBI_3003G042600 [Sorghum bicolor]